MKYSLKEIPVLFLITGFIWLFTGCGITQNDGNPDSQIINKDSYFYLLERSNTTLIMLNSQLGEVQRWNLGALINETSLQGITCDNKYLWISSAGSADKLFQIDISGNEPSIVRTIDAPPGKQGTVRDITWDGKSLWAVNSGSTTNRFAAQLFEINPVNGSVVNSFVIPSMEPRAITYSPPLKDAYNSGPDQMLYFSDTDNDKIFRFRFDRPAFDTAFSVPTPPRGATHRSAAGITCDGKYLWIVNNSTEANHLFKINSKGSLLDIFDLPYPDPGPIVWSSKDLRTPYYPNVSSITPSSSVAGKTIDLTVSGVNFRANQNYKADFGASVTVNSISFVSSEQLMINITILPDAAAGKRTVTFTFANDYKVVKNNFFEITLNPQTPYLWVADQNANQIFKINVNKNEIEKQFNTTDVTTSSPMGLGYDGKNILINTSSSDKKIYKLNTDGQTLASISSVPIGIKSGGTLRSVTYEAGSYWISVNYTSAQGRIFKLDSQTGDILDSLATPGMEPRGITFVNGSLYCNDANLDSVYIYNKQTGSWKAVFAIPVPPGGSSSNVFATGMTYDGQNFWILNSSNEFDYIFCIAPSGLLIKTIDAPRKGPGQLTGIVYTSN